MTKVGPDQKARNRRALVVAFCFPPHAAIGTHRTLRLVSYLVEHGWDVDVLSARPDAYLPGTPVDPQLIERIPPSVRVIHSGAFRGFNRAGRLISGLRGVRPAARATESAGAVTSDSQVPQGRLRALKTTMEELCALPDKDVGWLVPAVLRGVRAFSADPPDVIFSSAPPWTTHLVAQLLASAFGCRWVADFRDPWVRSPWTRYQTRAVMAVARRLERRVVRRADALVFTTETARNEFAEHYGSHDAGRFHVVFNGCDPNEFTSGPASTHDSRFTLLHAGTLYGGRSPVPLIRAVGSLCARNPSVASRLRVRFLGATGFPGVDTARLCIELGISGLIEFAPRVDREKSLRQMGQASALLILQSGTSMAIPGKLYEYLAAGRPILALCEDGEMADVIRANRVGIAVTSGDERAIEEALSLLLTSPPGSWAQPARELFDGRLRAAEMAAIVSGVLEPVVPETICAA